MATSRVPAGAAGRRAVALGRAVVLVEQLGHAGRRRQVDRRRQELEHELARVHHARRSRLHDHAGLDGARAARHEHARALDLHDAQPADVHRMQRLEIAERRDLDARASATASRIVVPSGTDTGSPSIVSATVDGSARGGGGRC